MLFVHPPKIDPSDYLSAEEAAKTAAIRLTSPPSQWDDEITQSVIREHPYLPADQMVVNFRQKDDTNGYAIGNISFSDNSNVELPIVVSNRSLSPVDVMILRRKGAGDQDTVQATGDLSEDEVLPLTEANFGRALDTAPIGIPKADADIKGVGYTEDGYNLRLPFRGRTVIASVLGASDTQKAAFGALLSQDKQAAAGLLLNGHSDVVSAWLKAEAPKGYLVKTASPPLSAAKVAAGAPAEVAVSDLFAGSVVMDSGELKTAVKVEVIDLAAPQKGLSQILVYADGSYSNAPVKVAAYEDGVSADSKAAEVISKIAAGSLVRGAYLMLQVDQAFTAPAKLASIVAREDQRAVSLRLEGAMGNGYNVTLDRRVKTAQNVDGSWILPMASKVFQLAGPSAEAPMASAKVAEWFDRRLPDCLTAADGQFSLTVRGQPVGGIVGEAAMASKLAKLISNGSELIAQAKTAGHVRFDSAIPATLEGLTKQAEQIMSLPGLASAAIADIRMPMDKALKLAAAIGDPEGADMVLGTGFLTEDNLSEFVALSAQLGDVVSKLARLLLAIRLGMPGDESATVVAMKALQRVRERLETAMTEAAAA